MEFLPTADERIEYMKDEDQNLENQSPECRNPGNRSQSNRSLENQVSESRVPENQRGAGHLRRLSRSLAYSGSVVDVYQDTMELPDGCIQKWDFV